MNERELRKLSFLAQVASLYYEQDMTQAEIASKLYISRTQVSRMLKQAKEKGLVEIKIHFIGERFIEMENLFKDRFGLREVRILNSRGKGYEDTISGLGGLAAEYLHVHLKEAMTLGISWGRAVQETVKALKPQRLKLKIVQINGAAAVDNPVIDSPELIRTAAQKYQSRVYYLNAPLYIEDDYVRQALVHEPMISETLRVARQSDVILTGIGALDQPVETGNWNSGYLAPDKLHELKQQGAVGFLCSSIYDIHGRLVNHSLNRRFIGMSLEDVRRTKNVVCVAGGKSKAEAILGAIRGKCFHVLITDDEAAKEILRMES